MSRLSILLYKEWRDQRALALAGAALCAAFLVVARLVNSEMFEATLRERLVVPSCVALFALVLAIEGITRDAQNGFEETLARMPIGRGALWVSKALFVVLAASALLALLTCVELGNRAFENGAELSDALDVLAQPLAWTIAASLAAACAGWACVLRRSLPAAFLGAASLGALPFLVWMLPVGRARELLELSLCSWRAGEITALACVAFVAGGLVAYRLRAVDRFGVKRTLAFAAGPFVLLLPALATSAARASDALDIVPFSPGVEIVWLSPSPDGRHVAMQVQRVWTPRDNWIAVSGSRTGDRVRVRHELWILDPWTGDVREIDERFRSFGGDEPWDDQGRVLAMSLPGSFGDGETTVELIDPSTARVVASRPDIAPADRGGRARGEAFGMRRGWSRRALAEQLGLSSGDTFTAVAPLSNVLFHVQDGVLVRHEIEPERVVPLFELEKPLELPLKASPDGRWLLVRDGRDALILDGNDGRVFHRCTFPEHFVDWATQSGSVAMIVRGDHEWVRLEPNGTFTELSNGVWGFCVELDRDHALVHDRERITRIDASTRERHVVYEPRR